MTGNDALILLALLLSRFLFLPEDRSARFPALITKLVLDLALLALLLPEPSALLLLGGIATAGNLALLLIERGRGREHPGLRALTLFALLLPLIFGPFPLRPWAGQLAPYPCAIAASALLALKETNFVVRWFFQRHRLAAKLRELPRTDNGRLIGNLERLLLLVFLWQGVAVAAPVIIAVKGLARFRQMDDPAFAEYVIIGTFLSVLGALTAHFLGTFI